MDKDKFIGKIKLPDSMEEFMSKDKDTSPYDLFYKWALKNSSDIESKFFRKIYGGEENEWGLPKEFVPSVSGFWLNDEDYKKLSTIVRTWLVKTHRMTKKEAERAQAMFSLSYAPASFYNELPAGQVYLTKDYIVRREKQ